MSGSVIMVAGMPRTASMWTYNVTRRLISLSGHRPWPVHIPPDPVPSFRVAIRNGVPETDRICIKIHAQFEGGLPDVKVLCNLRDARDTLMSYMRFTHCTFDEAIDGFGDSLALVDYYLGECGRDVFEVRYESITEKPEKTILQIASFTEISITPDQCAQIAEEFSRQNVSRYIDSLDTRSCESRPDPAGSVQRNADGSLRYYDDATGFQGGHISDSSGGEWRTRLNADQQARLVELTREWQVRHGYPA